MCNHENWHQWTCTDMHNPRHSTLRPASLGSAAYFVERSLDFPFIVILPFKSNSLSLATMFHHLVTQQFWTLTRSLPFFWSNLAFSLHLCTVRCSCMNSVILQKISLPTFQSYWLTLPTTEKLLICRISCAAWVWESSEKQVGCVSVVFLCFRINLLKEWILLIHFCAETAGCC